MQKEVGQVMPGRIEAEQLHIQHVGNPVEGRWKISVDAGEYPGQALPGEPFDDHVIIDIDRVVDVDELKADHLAENNHNQQTEQNENPAFSYWSCLIHEGQNLIVSDDTCYLPV